MNDKGKNKREWVKTVAIIFLSIMLVLTFFSNTIMNYSLPEVAAQYVQSGDITLKVRGNGNIESGDLYNVKIAGTRKVASVEVREGDTVQEGTVLCVLSSQDSLELEEARTALKNAQKEFDTLLLSGNLNASVMNVAGSSESTSDYKQEILTLQKEVEAAEDEVKKWQDTYDAYQVQIDWESIGLCVDTSEEEKAVKDAKDAMEKALHALTEAQNHQSALQGELDYQIGIGAEESLIESLESQLTKATYAVIVAQSTYNNTSLAYEKAQKALADKQEGDATNQEIENMKNLQAHVLVDLTKAQKLLEDKKALLEEAVKNINDEIALASLQDAIAQAKDKVEQLEKEVSGAEVVAPISGTITAVHVRSGLETPEDGVVFTIQPEGEEYTLSFSVTNEQAKNLRVGDMAEPVNSWMYDDISIILDSIRPDKTNPTKNKLLTFLVKGDNVVENQSLNVTVGQKSATYEMVVPNSAIREDNNGKFVLIVEAKSSPLGNRYIARRADVKVVASDDTMSAVDGELSGWEFVITTSNKPIENGQQVRLAE